MSKRVNKQEMTYDPVKGWGPKPGKKQSEKQTGTGPVPAEVQGNPVPVTEEKKEPAGQKKTGEKQKSKKGGES